MFFAKKEGGPPKIIKKNVIELGSAFIARVCSCTSFAEPETKSRKERTKSIFYISVALNDWVVGVGVESRNNLKQCHELITSTLNHRLL